MASKPTIAVIGSINMDLVTYTPRVPVGGETLTAHGFSVGLGGKGANQAVACAKVSRPKADVKDGTVAVKMIGAVGDDHYGGIITGGLQDVGIDTGDIYVREGTKTGASVIIVESDTGENRIMFCPQANATMRPEQFEDLPRPLPDMLVLQMEIPLETVTQILTTAKRLGVPVLLNPAPALKFDEKYYPCITHLIVNESEAAILSGCKEEDLESQDGRAKVAKVFHDLGVEYVLITLGSRGVYYSVSGKEGAHVPAEKVTAIDTTAAGDTFVGVYAVEAVKKGGFDIEKAVRLANKAASKTVLKKGAQESIPWRDEL